MAYSQEQVSIAAFAAAVVQGGGPIATHYNAYSVSEGTGLSFIQYVGMINRTAVKFDTGNAFLGSIPIAITFSFRKVGNPTGVIRTRIRKASDDSFIPIADWPAEYDRPGSGSNNNIYTVTAEGYNAYSIVANDKFSIEYAGTSANGIEILMNPQTANPTQSATKQ
jgi:hypothetical protein